MPNEEIKEAEESKYFYDEETLSAMEKISDDAFSGKTKTFTVGESMENIRAHRIKQ